MMNISVESSTVRSLCPGSLARSSKPPKLCKTSEIRSLPPHRLPHRGRGRVLPQHGAAESGGVHGLLLASLFAYAPRAALWLLALIAPSTQARSSSAANGLAR